MDKLERQFRKKLSVKSTGEFKEICFGHDSTIKLSAKSCNFVKIVIHAKDGKMFKIDRFNWEHEDKAVNLFEKYVNGFSDTLRNMQMLFLQKAFKSGYKRK